MSVTLRAETRLANSMKVPILAMLREGWDRCVCVCVKEQVMSVLRCYHYSLVPMFEMKAVPLLIHSHVLLP